MLPSSGVKIFERCFVTIGTYVYGGGVKRDYGSEGCFKLVNFGEGIYVRSRGMHSAEQQTWVYRDSDVCFGTGGGN